MWPCYNVRTAIYVQSKFSVCYSFIYLHSGSFVVYMNIVLRRFLHNHGNIATEGSPKPGLRPTLISNDFKGYNNSAIEKIYYDLETRTKVF